MDKQHNSDGRQAKEHRAGGPLTAKEQRAGGPLTAKELELTHAYWRACNYLSVGMIYLQDNPLLRRAARRSSTSSTGCSATGAPSPALSFVWVHLNRLIVKHDLDVIFVAGPGPRRARACSGRPTSRAPTRRSIRTRAQDEEGMQKFFKQFSFPGHIGSHVTPETPGSIHEGGELGYSLSHAYGMALRQPRPHRRLRGGRRRGRDRAARDGVALEQVHQSDARRRRAADPEPQRLQDRQPDHPRAHQPRGARGAVRRLRLQAATSSRASDPPEMHQKMAETLERAIDEIRALQQTARQIERRRRARAGR